MRFAYSVPDLGVADKKASGTDEIIVFLNSVPLQYRSRPDVFSAFD
ncbi:hypothetical protein HNQ93_003522 [Hymenobacter luteus]|uniref:Uncharacterized protein n=2 Tax=Hymenobacter TaxID=89966 RepID=A0A7W9T4L2_9BACT|nr:MULTISPECIES: hypothetical protein [Hymenobacter]MBB4602757.1 hypothetical protein [Hymenobacter latericoloratus]MBB6060648.1 hypothetical protein [Hymenobacter luteus]